MTEHRIGKINHNPGGIKNKLRSGLNSFFGLKEQTVAIFIKPPECELSCMGGGCR
jgi:hypothetical protein